MLPVEKSHGQGKAQDENRAIFFYIADDLGLRSPFIPYRFQIKSDTTYIVERVWI